MGRSYQNAIKSNKFTKHKRYKLRTSFLLVHTFALYCEYDLSDQIAFTTCSSNIASGCVKINIGSVFQNAAF